MVIVAFPRISLFSRRFHEMFTVIVSNFHDKKRSINIFVGIELVTTKNREAEIFSASSSFVTDRDIEGLTGGTERWAGRV